MINLEIKIRVFNSVEIQKKVLDMQAKFVGTLFQIDTYYIIGRMRLKLREEKDKSYFVYYKRSNILDSKFSKYYIVNIPFSFSKIIKKMVSFIFSIKVVVSKKRDLFIYKNTRIHLDKIDELGEFIELETIFVKNSKGDELKNEHSFVIDYLGLNNLEKIKESYSDLMFLKKDLIHKV